MERTRPLTRTLFIRELEEGPQLAEAVTTLAYGEEAGDGPRYWRGMQLLTRQS